MKHPLLGVGEGDVLCFSFQIHRNGSFLACVVFHNVFVLGKGWGRGCRKRDKLERSHFFSITIARLQGHHSQWVVQGDAPSRKHFNYGLLACVQEGAGLSEAGRLEQGFQPARLRKGNTQGGTQSNYHHQEQLQQYWSWAPVVHKQAIPFVQTFVLTPSYSRSRRKKAGYNLFLLNHQHLAG